MCALHKAHSSVPPAVFFTAIKFTGHVHATCTCACTCCCHVTCACCMCMLCACPCDSCPVRAGAGCSARVGSSDRSLASSETNLRGSTIRRLACLYLPARSRSETECTRISIFLRRVVPRGALQPISSRTPDPAGHGSRGVINHPHIHLGV